MSLTSPNEDYSIRVLTLNCWGLWLGAKKRRQRIAGIVRYLRENNCDIVFLQEVWVTADFEIIRDGTQDIYKFAHLFRSGSVLGSSGIVILCKWMPKVIHFEPYSLNGSPFYPWHGDWFAGKGIAYSRVDFDGLSLHLFSTHTHAYYNENESVHDQYSVHRVCQSYQLARFIKFISDTACNRKTNGKDLLIVAGDMNSTSSELPYKILTTMAGLTDCFKRSRYNNPSSNIIHRHKILGRRKQNQDTSESDTGNAISRNSHLDPRTFFQNKLANNYLLDTLDEYRSRIAQVFFDSDTDDEDITYCHPRNSFTPNYYTDYKPLKYDNNNMIAKNNNNDMPSLKGDHCELQRIEESQDDARSDSDVSVKQSLQSSDDRKSVRSKKSPMKRIDFILCRLLTHGHCVVDRIATQSKDPTMECSLSDHEPVMVELTISDVSHDLIAKNNLMLKNKADYIDPEMCAIAGPERSQPLATLVESKVNDASQLEETTNQWVSERTPLGPTYRECNIQVMEETKDILRKYYQYNQTSKVQLFYVILFMFLITLPTTTYYALEKDLIPISTVVFMWFAASFLFAIGLLIGFLCYRFEQGAIEAILNDIHCRIAVAQEQKV